MKIFAEMLAGHKEKGESTFSGADAFKLYDTYGFPIDLTIEMARDEGLEVDEAGYQKEMQAQKERAREARKALGDLGWAGVEFGKEVPATEFTGYESETLSGAKVVAMVVENEQADTLMPGVEAIVVLDRSPFYAEMGGQVADHGVIRSDAGCFTVTDVQKNKGGKYMHYGKLTEGTLRLGDTVTAEVDGVRRAAVRRAHTATHLLDKALKDVLGEHVHQAGSLVEPDRVRFDFTHFSAMTAEELERVTEQVNAAILAGMPVETEVLPIEEAKKKGAVALFGEKYGDTVRVVEIGGDYSVEFCGGTHLDNAAKAGVFNIVSEFSVASGVRRIEATTGLASLEALRESKKQLSEAAAVLKSKPETLSARLQQLLDEGREMRREIEKFKTKEAAGAADSILDKAAQIGGLKVAAVKLDGLNGDALRQMGDTLRSKAGDTVAVLAGVVDGKITFAASCGSDAVAKGIKAGDIIRTVTAICGGKGGGKPDSAMGGGSDVSRLDEALAAVEKFVNEHIK